MSSEHTCHDMNPPHPYPCLACEAERGERLVGEALDRAAVHLPTPLTYGRHECEDNSPPWFTGRWRDWHRGHGCRKDDGLPRSPEAIAEINRRHDVDGGHLKPSGAVEPSDV